MSTLETLEMMTRAWPASEREALGRQFGIQYTALRYFGTGSMDGLEFLFPFLNDSDRRVRMDALSAAGSIFHATGAGSLDKLDYVTRNRDSFIRDRSCLAVGEALTGSDLATVVSTLEPSYTHKNDFIRAQGVTALGMAVNKPNGPGLCALHYAPGSFFGSARLTGRAPTSLLPVFGERMRDRTVYVAANAITAFGWAFARTGDESAIESLASLCSFPSLPRQQGESWMERHMRWRSGLGQLGQAATYALADIAAETAQDERALALLEQALHPSSPIPDMGFEMFLTQRNAAAAVCSLLPNRPLTALRTIRFLLARLRPEQPSFGKLCRGVAIWCLPATFRGGNEEAVGEAVSLLEDTEYSAVKAGLLCLGIARQGSGDQTLLNTVAPFLAHLDGAVRKAAALTVGFIFQKQPSDKAAALLEETAKSETTNIGETFPLALGLIYQATGDKDIADRLRAMFANPKRRLAACAAFGVGLIYQGTGDEAAISALTPMLEYGAIGPASDALCLVDFDQKRLADCLLRWYTLGDGPGSALAFVRKHFPDLPTNR